MMTRYYQFAGVRIAVSMPEELLFEIENRLAAFRTESSDANWHFRFEKAEHLLPPEGTVVAQTPVLQYRVKDNHYIRYIEATAGQWADAAARAEYRERECTVQLRAARITGAVPVKYVLEAMAIEHLVARNSGFIFHCSYINRNGKAILFTAPSETGKSTQADLWGKYRQTEIINGDRAAIRLSGGRLLAEGIPFAGSSQYCKNRSLPLESIVYLGQAPVTTIRRLKGYESFSKIWEGVSVNRWDKTDMEMVSAVVQKAAAEIPMFHMPCTPDESAVIVLEDALEMLVNP